VPPTLELACEAADCELDMVELHFTYELVGADVDDFRCPVCNRTETLRRLSYTYDED
jgi:hypothetical protein